MAERRPSERARTADSARLAAYTGMRAIAQGAYANLELPRVLREKRVSGRDAAFATELVYGATRLRGRYDPIIAAAADRPLSKIDPGVLDILRLGAHQLLGMRVPSHAAVDSSVALARQVNGIGASGFVNAVLRRIDRMPVEEWVSTVTQGLPPIEALALETSHPEWVVKALRAALLGHGAATPDSVDAELAELLAADNAPAKVSLVARPGLIDRAELVAEAVRAGAVGTSGALAPTAVLLDGGDPGAIPAVRDGRAAVQDEGSQLVALALAAAETTGTDTGRWLDVCAGPGGKAGLLAGVALRQGVRLTANEVNPTRADLVRHSLAAILDRDPGAVELLIGDGQELGAERPGAYDRVLVDAPCTGLGALRRRPEARWRRVPGDIADLAPLQRGLLESALDATRSGGVTAYVTCSPHLGETKFVVSDVVKKRADVEILDARPAFETASRSGITGSNGGTRITGITDLGDGPFVQLWPHRHGTDAMFCALLRRR